MNRLLAVASGAMAGFGVWLITVTLTGHPITQHHFDTRTTTMLRAKATAVGRGVLIGVAAAAVTRWWALVPLVTAGSVLFTGRFGRHAAHHDGLPSSATSWTQYAGLCPRPSRRLPVHSVRQR